MEETMQTTRSKSESVTFRIDSKVLKNLRHEAEQKDVSTNTLVNQIIKDHLIGILMRQKLVLYLSEDHLFQRS